MRHNRGIGNQKCVTIVALISPITRIVSFQPIRDYGYRIHRYSASASVRFGSTLREIVLPAHAPLPFGAVNVKEMEW